MQRPRPGIIIRKEVLEAAIREKARRALAGEIAWQPKNAELRIVSWANPARKKPELRADRGPGIDRADNEEEQGKAWITLARSLQRVPLDLQDIRPSEEPGEEQPITVGLRQEKEKARKARRPAKKKARKKMGARARKRGRRKGAKHRVSSKHKRRDARRRKPKRKARRRRR